MKTQKGYLQTKPQQGFSMFLVLGLLLMTTIMTTAVYQALNQSNLSSKNVMEAQSADAAAKAGKAASEAFMQYNAGEIAAIIHQFLKNQEAASPGAAVPPVEIPLKQMGVSKDQNFRVSLVDLNVTQPIEVKIQSEGFAADGSKKVLTSVYYLKGIYFEDLSITTGDVRPGDADGSMLQDAIWGGGNTTLCGAVRLGSAGGVPSSLYAGEDLDVNVSPCSGNPVIDGSAVIGYGTGTSTLHGQLLVHGDFYTGGEVNHGGGASSTLTVNGNVQIMNDWNVVNGSAALHTPGDVYVKGDISSGGAGAMAWQLNGGSLKIDGSLAGSFYGTNTIQGYNYNNFGNDASWDLDIDATSATSSGSFNVTGLWIENIQSNITDPNNLIHENLTPNHNTANPIDSADIDIDDIVAQINSEGEKNHPFHVKADMEAKYSKTWAEWVTLCDCGLSSSTIGGSQLNTLVSSIRAAGDADELFVDGAPMINANDLSLNFVGGQLIEKVIIRKDENAKGVVTLFPHTASTLGNPGGNLTVLASGNYYDFHTDGNTNLLVYANGDHFEYKDISGGGNDILYGNITAKDATGGELKIHGAPTINFSQNVIEASFSGGVFSLGAEEDAVINSSSSTITSIALDDRIRLEAPTLNIQFMGSFVNQVSVVDQQSLDASTLQTAKPFLTFNRQTILSLKDVYTDFDEMRAALGIVPIYSYRGESSNCTTPSENDYYSADFDGANDSTFTVSLTINCSYQGEIVSATSSIWVTMGAGSGAPDVSSVAVSSVAGSSTNTSSVGTSSDGVSDPALSSSDAVSSSAVAEPVCTKLPMTVLGVGNVNTAYPRVSPAKIGRFDRSNPSWDYEVMMKPDLSGIRGTINSAEIIIDWGSASNGTPELHIEAYLQNALTSWNINSRYNDFPTSNWATGNTLFANDDVTPSSTGELIMHNEGTNLIEWIEIYAGDADNGGLVLISNSGQYWWFKTVNAAYLNVCSTLAVAPVSSSVAVSSSSATVSSVAVSSSSVEVSSEAATYTVTVDALVPAGVDCYVDQSTTSGLASGSTFSVQLICGGDWATHTSKQWKIDGVHANYGTSTAVTVTSDLTIKAYVTKLQYTVNVIVDPAGSATPMASKTVDAKDNTSISVSNLGAYTMYGWVHDPINTSISTNETIIGDITYTAIMKAPVTDCDGSGDYSSEASYAVGTHVKHNDKLWQCNQYQNCDGVTPGSNGSIWIEEESCAAVNTCTAYTAGICAWNGSSYACPSDKMSDDGTTAWKCNGGAYCQFGPSYAGNAWGAWSSRGSCF